MRITAQKYNGNYFKSTAEEWIITYTVTVHKKKSVDSKSSGYLFTEKLFRFFYKVAKCGSCKMYLLSDQFLHKLGQQVI